MKSLLSWLTSLDLEEHGIRLRVEILPGSVSTLDSLCMVMILVQPRLCKDSPGVSICCIRFSLNNSLGLAVASSQTGDSSRQAKHMGGRQKRPEKSIVNSGCMPPM